MISDKSQAEDITQEVFLIAYEKGRAFLMHEKPEAFLYRTAKNLIYESIRKQKKENKVELDDNLCNSEVNDVYDSIYIENDRAIDEATYVDRILSQLLENEYNLYLDYYIKHKTIKIIASDYHTSEVAVRMKYVRLRKKVSVIVKSLKLGEI